MNERSPQHLYRKLPSVDRVLSDPAAATLVDRYGATLTTAAIRALLDEAREYIKNRNTLPEWLPLIKLLARADARLDAQNQISLRPVFNLTGVVLHTNLGRARLADAAIDAATRVMREAVTLEYSLGAQSRGHRDAAVSELLRVLTGGEAACVVNNNAAAVLLMFAAIADDKEAIASRGELIEIGGSFRIPDVMRQAGCRLVEVGTTNRTHLEDYRNAINENTALMVKVHTSNYKIQGFTASVSEAELAALGRETGVPVAADLGSGTLIEFSDYGLTHETTPQELLRAGVDLVSFSGDKLLGGPQAGIVVGRAALIERLQKHPLKRALRCDKTTLAALEATLRLYLRPDNLAETLPTLRYLTRRVSDICADVERLLTVCRAYYGRTYIVESETCLSQIGSGSLPLDTLPSRALTFAARDGSGRTLECLSERWHVLPKPIIGRIQDAKLWLDLRALDDGDELERALIAAAES
ncbi:MAG: L-seryl-tRNA(Sec) selenium transferase [Burkholderiales bacterium]|jgi:L-seryl-tRNA(Ser) seleniumtransferase|nr:L-seryl-tRNA(Sec) selenium transferase [Burkholderiales bacterium]